MRLSASTVKLIRLTQKLANRFERLEVDEAGAMDPDDKKLLDAVRKQADRVLAEPMKKHLAGKS